MILNPVDRFIRLREAAFAAPNSLANSDLKRTKLAKASFVAIQPNIASAAMYCFRPLRSPSQGRRELFSRIWYDTGSPAD